MLASLRECYSIEYTNGFYGLEILQYGHECGVIINIFSKHTIDKSRCLSRFNGDILNITGLCIEEISQLYASDYCLTMYCYKINYYKMKDRVNCNGGLALGYLGYYGGAELFYKNIVKGRGFTNFKSDKYDNIIAVYDDCFNLIYVDKDIRCTKDYYFVFKDDFTI